MKKDLYCPPIDKRRHPMETTEIEWVRPRLGVSVGDMIKSGEDNAVDGNMSQYCTSCKHGDTNDSAEPCASCFSVGGRLSKWQHMADINNIENAETKDEQIAELRALIASLKRCGTCRHCRSHEYYDALCAIDKTGKNRRDTCDKWEIDQ